MKYLRLACICILCASPTMLHAQNGIQLISQSYNISASWSEDVSWFPPQGQGYTEGQPYPGDWSAGYQLTPDSFNGYIITGGYNLSSSDGSPLAASTAAPWPLGGSPLADSASIDLFSVQNNAYAYPTGAGGTPPLGGTVYFKGNVQTSVQADWLFSPIGNSLDVSINAVCDNGFGPEWGNLTVTLSDMTDSTTLLNNTFDDDYPSNYPYAADDTFAVNPSDIYELSVSGWSNTYDMDFLDQDVTASITSVPEPGACLLLPSGLAGLLGFKRRFKS